MIVKERKKSSLPFLFAAHLIIVLVIIILVIVKGYPDLRDPVSKRLYSHLWNVEFPDNTTEMRISFKGKEDYDKVLFAVWSDTEGQDDLQWYEAEKKADNVWKSTVDLCDHRSWGEYNIHAFISRNGTEQCLTRTKVTAEPPFSFQVSDDYWELEFLFEPIEKYDAVELAVWSDSKGLSDLGNYRAELTDDGKWKCVIPLIEHYSTGHYHIEVYSTKGDIKSLLANTTTIVKNLPEDYVFKTGLFEDFTGAEIVLKTAKQYPEIKICSWCEGKGVDSFQWLKTEKLSNNQWKTQIKFTSDSDSEIYRVQAFANDKEENDYIAQTSVSAAGTCDVSLSEDKTNLKIRFTPSFSPENVLCGVTHGISEQGDLRWYSLKDAGDGVWETKAELFGGKTAYIRIYRKEIGGQSYQLACAMDIYDVNKVKPKEIEHLDEISEIIEMWQQESMK